MRIYHLTPGTANFHCGSCLRDLDLVRRLQKAGHEVMLVPLYLPLMHDDSDSGSIENAPMFLGGVNLYLQQKSGLFRYLPRWLSRLLDSDKLLHKAASRANMTSAKLLGEMTLGSFQATEGRQKKEWKKLVDWLKKQPKPDVVSISNGLLIGVARAIRSEIGSPVVCSLQGEDTFIDGLPENLREKCWQAFRDQCPHANQFVAVSRYYRDRMQDALQLPDEKITHIWNGIDLDKFPLQPQSPEQPVIGYLARMCRDKGLENLVTAYISLADIWRTRAKEVPRLRIAGAMTPGDEPLVAEMKSRLEKAKLSDRVEWLPNISFEEKIAFLHSISVLTVPAMYGESFGLYVIEAMACGVPVLQPEHAGFPELIAESGGGVLFSAGDSAAYVEKLDALLKDASLRGELGKKGRMSVERIFNAERMAMEFVKVCEDVAGGGE